MGRARFHGESTLPWGEHASMGGARFHGGSTLPWGDQRTIRQKIQKMHQVLSDTARFFYCAELCTYLLTVCCA